MKKAILGKQSPLLYLTKWYYLILFLFLFLGIQAQNIEIPGKIRVKVTDEMAAMFEASPIPHAVSGNLNVGTASLNQIHNQFNAKSYKRVYPHAGKFEAKHRKYGLHLWYEIDIDKSKSIKEACDTYMDNANITLAEPIYYKKNITSLQSNEKPLQNNTLTEAPNDPSYEQQWHFNNTGQSRGTIGADIDLEKAWEIETGSADVIVAVIDMGIDSAHEDLAESMWINEAEIPNNGIDDDNNGYVDDVNGYNFVENIGAIEVGFHGTHVAGIVAAKTNNEVGIAGVAGGDNPSNGVRLMSCQVFDLSADLFGGLATSFIYAADNGAVIAQNSWGYGVSDYYEQSVLDGINYFIAEAGYDENGNPTGPMQGGIVIFSAGNDGVFGKQYPGAFDEVIAVAATDQNDDPADFSNRGDWVTLSAPGESILSTFPNNRYRNISGTSMACPQVSGVAALIVSKYAGNITPDEVWSRLVGATDPLPYSFFGSGRLNAFNSLQENQNIPPEAITDLSVTNTEQNTLSFSLTAPKDQDNISAFRYEIRYATEPITAANYDTATKVSGNYFASEAGTIDNLSIVVDPSTNYYIAIKSFDYFNNKSEISNVVSAMSNSAALIEVIPDGLVSMPIDASVNSIGSSTFAINNIGNDVLNYNLTAYPGASRLLFPGSILGMNEAMLQADTKSVIEQQKIQIRNSFNTTEQKSSVIDSIYHDSGNENISEYIGTNTTERQSFAVKFEVNQPSFELTHVRNAIQAGEAGAVPIIVEIYKGATLGTATLLISQEVVSDAESGMVTFPLLIPQYFEAGDVFWIVHHFPLGYNSPQGIEEGTPERNRYFFTFDEIGIYTEGNSIFKTRALSGSNDETLLVLGDYEASIEASNTNEISATFNASSIPDGTYNYSIALTSNDPQNPFVLVPLEVNVTGHQPEIVVNEQVLRFNNHFLGEEETKQLTISNTGFSDLQITNITSSTPEFSILNEAVVIKSGESSTIDVTFTPTTTGAINGTLSLITNDLKNSELTIQMVGLPIEPPLISVNPDSITTTAIVGEMVSEKITISNTGSYPLLYSFPELGANVNGNMQANDNSYGYSWIDSNTPGGPVFIWNDIKDIGTEILKGEDDDEFTLDLPFVFNFFGEAHTRIDLNTNGILFFDRGRGDNEAFPIPSPDGINYFIAGYQTDLILDEEDGGMYYQVTDDKLIVQYEKIGLNEGEGTATFQIVINKRGNIMFYYRDMSSLEIKDENISIGIEDENGERGVEIAHNTAYVEDGLAVMIVHPVDFIAEVSPMSGVIGVGESTEIDIALNTNSLLEGSYVNELLISSNDPNNSSLITPVTLTVIGEQEVPIITPNSLEFGEQFIGVNKLSSFTIKNPGNKALTIDKIENTSNEFTFDVDFPLVIGADDTLEIVVIYTPVQVNTISDVFTISTDVEGSEQLFLNVSGTGALPPIINTDANSFELSGFSGEQIPDTLQIQNTGANPLTYTIKTPGWLNISREEEQTVNNGNSINFRNSDLDYGYLWTDNEENGGPIFDFIDITQTGIDITEETFTNSSTNLSIGFDFLFYGNTYSNVWLSSYGMLYFAEEPLDRSIVSDKEEFPEEDNINNFITGLWEAISQDFIGSIHYQVSEENFIVQFTDILIVADDVFNLEHTATFQMILYPNGDIKFQYKDIDPTTFHLFNSFAGIENAAGTDGFMTAAGRSDTLKDGLSVLIKAPHNGVIMPGEEVALPMIFDATYLNNGNYVDELRITSNDPLNNQTIIPLNFTVIGNPSITVEQDVVDFEEVILQDGIATATKTITIKNTGSDTLIIDTISIANTLFTTSFDQPISIEPNEETTVDISLTADSMLSFTEDLVITSNDLSNESLSISMTGKVVDLPQFLMTTENDTIYAKVPKNGKYNSLIRLENKAVAGTLSYENEISYLQIDNEFLSNQNNRASKSLNQEANFAIQDSLYHHDRNNTDLFLDIDGENFATAVKFVVGEEENFKLTHIQNSYNSNNEPITIKVYKGGNMPNEGELLLSQQHVPQASEGFELIALNTPQLIRANETFWIVIEYPFDSSNSEQGQGVVRSLPPSEYAFETFYYSLDLGNSWLPSEGSFSGLGYQIRALGSKYIDWITLDTTQGEVIANSNLDINVQLNAAGLNSGTYFANINIASNDPLNATNSIPVRMMVNSVPEFYEAPINTLVVTEGQSIEVILKANDSDGEILAYTLNENYDNVAFEASSDMAKIIFSPDFTQSGLYSFTVNAFDDLNDEVATNFTIEVVDTNRPPILVKEIPRQVFFGNDKKLDLSNYIQDPDNDKLSYAITATNPDLIDLIITGNILSAEALKLGYTNINIIALDDKDAKVETSFGSLVIPSRFSFANKDLGESLDEQTTKLSNEPNPFDQVTTIKYNVEQTGYVRLEVHSFNGKLIETLVDQTQEAGNYKVIFDRKSMSSGTYIYTIQVDGQIISKKMILK